MRLNKYQYAWIRRLKSGKTRKCKNELNDGKGSFCCLGVGINSCKLEKISSRTIFDRSECLDGHEYPQTYDKLNLKSEDGKFDWDKVSDKWKDILKEKGISKQQNFLIYLNDDTNMSHKTIGQFIDENREAVFKG